MIKTTFALLCVVGVLGVRTARADDWVADVLDRGATRAVTATAPASTDSVLLDNVITGPSTAPVPVSPTAYAERSIAEFIGHFSGYEPTYVIAGPADPLAKFQFSFKYQLLSDDAPLAKKIPFLAGFNFGYTQLSLWQLDKRSAPFFDTNYEPEFLWSNEDVRLFKIPGVSQFGLQAGYGHDSNGRDGATSRSLNILFIRPIVTFGDPDHFHFLLAPKIYAYVASLDDNPDIAKYRGYVDIRATIGWKQGLELSALGRVGSDYNRGSVLLDLTYPIRDLLNRNLDLYLDAQYFYGYGESLLQYNQRRSEFRIGFALVR